MGRKRLVHSWGINDADYVTQPTVNGKQVWCKYYQLWVDMVRRGFSDKFKQKCPTYKEVTVSDEWKYFMTFRKWCVEYEIKYRVDISELQLDKDILHGGNKEYNPLSCCFVDLITNTFLINRAAARGDYMVGVNWHKCTSKFVSQCGNPFTGKQEHLGLFTDELQAHRRWQTRKHEHACRLADLQHDPRIAEALRTMYTPDKDWAKV